MQLYESQFLIINREKENNILLTNWKTSSIPMEEDDFYREIFAYFHVLKMQNCTKILFDFSIIPFSINDEQKEWILGKFKKDYSDTDAQIHCACVAYNGSEGELSSNSLLIKINCFQENKAAVEWLNTVEK